MVFVKKPFQSAQNMRTIYSQLWEGSLSEVVTCSHCGILNKSEGLYTALITSE